MNRLLLVFLLPAVCAAQKKPIEPLKSESSWSIGPYMTSGAVITWPKLAQTSETITKDGHYIWKLDDPNNQLRCHIVSTVVDHDDTLAFTVVCVKPHEVSKEK